MIEQGGGEGWDADLEGVYLDIARSTDPKIGILAGPGTGKTRYGLIRRVARLLSEGVDPKRILLISFTRVAAADLRDKVEELNETGTSDVRAATLHAYCLSLLTREAVLAYTQRVPRILMAHEADLMLRDLGGSFGDIRQRRTLLKAFEAGWARTTQDHPGLATIAEDRQFDAAVLRWLKDHQAILIGEVVPLAYDFLRHNPASSELTAFDHIIVDEYQDLDTCEQHLLDILAEHASLCIAGDDDQSIYSMRYANPTGILEFADRDEVTTFQIFSCGRCPQLVIDLANALIRCSSAERTKNDLVSVHPETGVVDIVQWDTLDDEINGTIAAIASELRRDTYQPGDVLVLTHRRLIGERIRDGLRALSIPVESFFTEEELKAEVAQEALALLRLALNPNDLPALRVILGIGDDTGRSMAYQKVWAQARTDGTTTRTILERLDEGDDFGFRASALLDRFQVARRRVSELDLESLPDLVDRLFPDGTMETAELREVALAELEGVRTAQQLLDRLVVIITQDEVPQHPTFVRIMSLHKSKGLTSPRVYVAGLIEGVVPTLANRQGAEIDAAIEEQRRLLYVALTRTAERITLSNSLRMDFSVASAFGARVASGTTWGRRGSLTCGVIASRYLRELGPNAPRAVRGAAWLEGLTGS